MIFRNFETLVLCVEFYFQRNYFSSRSAGNMRHHLNSFHLYRGIFRGTAFVQYDSEYM